MIANYHNHTFRCHHATGTEREYIERALAAGFTEIGFSDHTPMPFEGDYYSNFRMRFDALRDYCDTLSALKEEYKDRIIVHIGLEAEYYPRLFPTLIERLRDYPISYLILGQHFIENEFDGVYSGEATSDLRVLTRYVDQVIDGMETGCFSYVAHPDLLHYTGDSAILRCEMVRLAHRAKELDIPLEVNFLGIWNERHYPSKAFFEALGEVKPKVIFGCDAHSAETAVQDDTELRARVLLAERGITPIKTLPLRPIF